MNRKKLLLVISILLILTVDFGYSDTIEDFYNNLIGPSAKYDTFLSKNYLRNNTSDIDVDSKNGSLTLVQTDFVLSGRNGLDVELTRIYKSKLSDVDNMKVENQSGTVVDVVETGVDAISFLENRYNLGAATRFSFPTLEILGDEKYLHTESGAIFRLINRHQVDNKYTFDIESHPAKDFSIWEDTSFNQGHADDESKFMKLDKDGKKTYFSSDGRVLAVVDRYGNQITFEYGDFDYTLDSQTINRRLMTKIIDTVGREFNFVYNEDLNHTVTVNGDGTFDDDIGSLFNVVVYLPDDTPAVLTDNPKLVYEKKVMMYSETSNKVVRTQLADVYDMDGSHKYGFIYEQNGYGRNDGSAAGFTYKNGNTYTKSLRSEILTGIDYPEKNKRIDFTYGMYTKNLGDDGSLQYRKIESVEHKSRSLNDQTSEIEYNLENKITYSYTNEPDGYGTSGYLSSNDYLKNTFKYYTTKTDLLGYQVKFTYNGLHEQENVEKLGPDHKIVSVTTFDEFSFPEMKVTNVHERINGTDTGKKFSRYENFDYDEYGNLLEYTSPRAERDVDGNPIGTKFSGVYIRLDGETDDWDGIEKIATGSLTTEFIKVAQDDTLLNILIEGVDVGTDSHILIDADNDPLTGYNTHKWADSGGDYLIDGNRLYEFIGSHQKEYLWNQIDTITPYQSNDRIEITIQQSKLSNTSAKDMKIAYWNDTIDIPVEGPKMGLAPADGHIYNEYTVVYEYARDKYHQLKSKTWKNDTTSFSRTEYQIDSNGNVTEEKRIHEVDGTAKNIITTYSYDSYGNLIQEVTDLNFTTNYEYGTDFNGVNQQSAYLTKEYWTVDGVEQSVQHAYDFYGGIRTGFKDELGSITTYTYDDLFRLETKTYPNASTETYTYTDSSTDNSTMTYIDRSGVRTIYTYNIFGDMIKYQEDVSVDGVTSLETLQEVKYNSNGYKIKETDFNGNSTRFNYDSDNRLISKAFYLNDQTLEFQESMTYIFSDDSSMPLIIEVTDQEGYKRKDYYNRLSELVKSEAEYEAGQYTDIVYTYDYSGNLKSTLDGKGNQLSRRYDDLNQLVSQTNALNETTEFEYDARGLLIKTLHPNGHEVTKEYDARGRLIKETQNNTAGVPVTTRFIYDAKGRLIKTILPEVYDPTKEGTVELMTLPGESATYDLMGNVTEKYLADGTLYEKNYYNQDDSLRKTVNGNSNTGNETDPGFTYTYNNQGDVIKIADPYGNETHFTYDLMGNQLTETDKLGRVTISEYDALGQLIKTTLADGAVLSFDYDDKGNMIKQTDALNNETQSDFDGLNRLVKTTFEDGSIIEYTYDDNGNIITKTLKNGAVVEYIYDALDRLIETKTPLFVNDQSATEYSIVSQTYNNMGQVVSRTMTGTQDPLSSRVSMNVYHTNGLLEYSVSPSGGRTFYEYDNNGNVIETAVERSSGQYNRTKYEYNDNDLVVLEKKLMEKWPLYDFQQYLDIPRLVDDEDPDKVLITKGYEYDALGNVVQTMYPKAYMYEESDTANRNKFSEFFEYDLLNRLVKKSWYDEGSIVFEQTSYDKMDNVISSTNAAGHVTEYVYDSRNRKVEFKDENNKVTKFEYDLNGNMTRVINANNQSIYSYYDSMGRLVETRNDSLQVTGRNVFNLYGQLIKKIDAEGYDSGIDDASRYGIEYTYDLAGRLVSQLDPESKDDGLLETVKNEYNQYSEVVKSTNANGSTMEYVYDDAGFLTKTKDALNNETLHTYDLVGNSKTTTDGNGHVTEYYYHDQNVLYTQTDADDKQMVFRYDISLNTVAIRTKNSNTIQNVYDNLGRLVEKFNNDGQNIYYEYDVLGNRIKMTDESGITIYSYDNKNQLVSKSIDSQAVLSYTYDDIGNKLSMTDEDNIVTNYIYDNDNRLESATTIKGASSYVSTYTYDNNGNRLTHVEGSSGVRTAYTYDKNNRLISQVSYDAGDNEIFSGVYVYDNAGNQISKTENGQTTSLVYDGLNRASIINYPNGDVVTYTYDGAGNRLIETQVLGSVGTDFINDVAYNYSKLEIAYSYTNANQLLNVTSKHLNAQDTEIFRKIKDHYYDDNGNDIQEVSSTIIQDVTAAPAFDISAVTSMTSAIHPAFVLNEHVRKVYDGYNRAVEFETVKPTGITIAKMTYNGDNLRVTRQVERVQEGKTETISYLYDGAYVMREEASGQTDRPASLRYIVGTSYVGHIDSNDNVQMYLYNGHGDTIEVFDTSRNVLNTYDYDIFGKSTESNESSYETHIRYAGEYYDSDTGFYYLRARYYNPVTGRFVNEDSVWGKKHQPLSLNLYTYAYNNPVRFIDPSGHVVTDWERTNLSKSNQRKVARAGQDWTRANERLNDKNTLESHKAGYREIMRLAHERANKARSSALKDNERVQSNGYVVSKSSKTYEKSGSRREYDDGEVNKGRYKVQNGSSGDEADYVVGSSSDFNGTIVLAYNPSQIDEEQVIKNLYEVYSNNSEESGTWYIKLVEVENKISRLKEQFKDPPALDRLYADVSAGEVGGFYGGNGGLTLENAPLGTFESDFYLLQDHEGWEADDFVPENFTSELSLIEQRRALTLFNEYHVQNGLYDQYVKNGAVIAGSALITYVMTRQTGMNSSATLESTDDIINNPESLYGKTAEEIAKVFRNEGYEVIVEQSTKGSSLAEIVRVKGHQVNMVQVHPGGGRHGLPYTKVKGNGVNYKVIDGTPADYIGNPAGEKGDFFWMGE